MKRYIRYIGILLLLPLLAACAEDTLTTGADGPEGESAEITLSFSVPEQDRLSRANISDENAYRVNSVWVGIFNAGTGEMTNENKLIEYSSSPVSGFHGNGVTISGLSTKSGYSYIVMVANPDENEGIDINRPTEIKLLSELLAGVRTLDDYRCISAHISSIETPAVGTSNGLAMAGAYHSSATQDPASWETLEKVFIPMGKSTLQGAVHLRRLLSQIKFEITTGEDVEEFEPISYTVYNVPNYSWLQERAQTGTGLDYANAGDYLNSTEGLNNPSYPVSDIYRSTYFSKTGNTYSFDFWQFENKRTGIIPAADLAGATKEEAYAMRERQFNTDGNPVNPNAAAQTQTNTGIFTSLSAFNESKGSVNNCATYVKINGRLNLKTTTGDNALAQKVADVTYTVHLGYIGEQPNNFESLRNSIYTYQMTINGVDNIEIEAHRKGNEQPGAAGIISTIEEDIFECDGHFAIFNIYLSKDELSKFSFSMTTYSDNKAIPYFHRKEFDNNNNLISEDDKAPKFENGVYTFDGKTYNPAAANSANNNLNEWMQYSWIELTLAHATDNPDDETYKYQLVRYPGRQNTPDSDTPLYRLNDISGKLEAGWYTVYVHEYTYEWDADESSYRDEDDRPRWTYYVDQSPRSAYLNVAEAMSADSESAIYTSKYAIFQRSIQTYYNTNDLNSTATALGIEKDNEIFGLNLMWSVTPVQGTNSTYSINGTAFNNENGRFNTWIGLKNGGTSTDAIEDGWSTHLESVQLNLPAVNKQGINLPARRPNLLQPVLASGNGSNNTYNPQSQNEGVYVIAACLNRNVDLNGDGHISPDEMKWYVPSRGNYLRMIIGRSSLDEPLMDYDADNLQWAPSTGHNTRFHIATSDYYQLWLDEGLSSGFFYNTGQDWVNTPWQVRCVRNLGTNLANVTRATVVSPAYEIDMDEDTSGGIIKVSSYYGTSLRSPTESPLPIHYANQEPNKMGRYGFEICTFEQGSTLANYPSNQTYLERVTTASPCETLNSTTATERSPRKGWRIPNQEELAIMMRGGFFSQVTSSDNRGTVFYSCTREPYSNSYPFALESFGSTPRWSTVELLGVGIGTACQSSNIRRVRCVRDLTAAEANMTYQQVLNYSNK